MVLGPHDPLYADHLPQKLVWFSSLKARSMKPSISICEELALNDCHGLCTLGISEDSTNPQLLERGSKKVQKYAHCGSLTIGHAQHPIKGCHRNDNRMN